MTNPTPAQCVEKFAQCQIPAQMAAWTTGCVTRWSDKSLDPIIADVSEDGILWAAYGVIAGKALQTNTDAEQAVTMAGIVALSAYAHAVEQLLHQGIPAEHPLFQTASTVLRYLHDITVTQLRAVIPES